MFDSLHGLSHPGIRATQKLVTTRFVWPGVNADVRRWTRACIQCQRTKIQRHSSTPLSTFPKPNARFDVVHIDLVGPLPTSQGYTYLLTCIDRFTWPEAIPLTAITAEVVAQAFLAGWIARFGVPSIIVTDRGRQFESKLWGALTTLLGVKRARTTAYHPQSNGMIDRFHRQLKAALKAQPNPSSWMEVLPLVLLGIRTAVKEDMSATTAEMVYGTTLRLPGELFTLTPIPPLTDSSDFANQLKSRMRLIRPPLPRPTQRTSQLNKALSTATHVFIRHDAVRKPLQPPYNGPYPVLKRTDKFYTVDIHGRKDTVCVDRLKPAHLDADEDLHSTHSPEASSDTPDTPLVVPNRVTRSGRQIRWPKHLSNYLS